MSELQEPAVPERPDGLPDVIESDPEQIPPDVGDKGKP